MITIKGTSEKVGKYFVWEVYEDDHMVCAVYGPMSASMAGLIAESLEKGVETTAMSVIPYSGSVVRLMQGREMLSYGRTIKEAVTTLCNQWKNEGRQCSEEQVQRLVDTGQIQVREIGK